MAPADGSARGNGCVVMNKPVNKQKEI